MIILNHHHQTILLFTRHPCIQKCNQKIFRLFHHFLYKCQSETEPNLIQIANGDIYYFSCLWCLLQFSFHFSYLFNQNFKFSRYFQVLLTTLLPHQFSVLISCMFYQHQSTHKQKYFHYILKCSYRQLAQQLYQIFITRLMFHHQ